MLEALTLPGLLSSAATAIPDRVAISVASGETLTFGSWDRSSDVQARGLQRAGLGAGKRVAIVFDNARWTQYAVTYLAVQKAGAVAVPLGPHLGDIELARILRHCRAAAVLAPGDLAPAGAGIPVVDPAGLRGDEQGDALSVGIAPSDLCELLYLCRPLSRPLPIPRSQGAVASGLAGVFAGDAGSSSLLHALPVGTLGGQDLLSAALQPTPIRPVALPDFDPERACALLAAGGARGCVLHPSTAPALVDAATRGDHDLSGVTRIVLTSGRVSAGLLLRVGAAFPRAALILVDVLGRPAGVRTVFMHDRDAPGALGRAVHGAVPWVTDEAGRRVGPGEVGRVWVRGTEEPAEPPDDHQAVETGDLGYLDDRGRLYVVGSRREVVRSRPSTVLRAEVEDVLRGHPGVVDAAVLGAPQDDSEGELVAAVALRSPVAAEELKALVRARLGDHKTPARIFFVDAVPRGAGVVLEGHLRRRLGPAAVPVAERVEATPVQEAVQVTPVQDAVATAFRRALRVGEIGLDDDFFEQGGDEFAALTVLRLLEDAFDVRVPVAAFLDAPTVAGLASALERLRGSDETATSDAPVAFSQEGMLWHEVFAPGSQNLPGLARRYRGRLDAAALERALDEILRRQAALRTGFELRDGRVVQVVRPHRSLRLEVRDLTDAPAPEREARIEALVADAGRRPFDLVDDALFEPTLYRLAEDDHVLVVRAHHSVFDDWSVGVFRRELTPLYTAYSEGRPSPLPELPLAFHDFSRRQRRRLAGPAGERELKFWRRELAGAPFVTQLPVDDPDLPVGSPQPPGEPVELLLPQELADGLRALASRQRATVFMTMLAAFGVLVHRYTGQDDLLLATVVANRNRTELEGVIGCFTKKVPLRLGISGDPTFAEALSATRAALLGALSHQDLPFEAVVQDVLGAPAASHGLAPHVAVMFQGVTPRQELTLPDVDTAGFETSTTASRAHFMARPSEGPGESAPPPAWGAGLYLGTFVILSVDESGGELSCVARGAFHPPSVRRLLDSFRALLEEIVADPDRPLSELTLLDGRASAELSARGRGPQATLPADTLADVFAAQVARAPQAAAVRMPGRTLTFAELDARSSDLCVRLQALDSGPGSRVGVCLEPGPGVVVATLAAWKAGAACVVLDPGDDHERLSWAMTDAAVEVVVSEAAELPGDARVVPVGEEAGRPAGRQRDPVGVGPDDEAVVFYGSGPSGVDRAVVLDHRAVLNLLAGLRHAVLGPAEGAPGTRRVCLCPRPTDDAFFRELVALLDGHALYVPDRPLCGDPGEAVSLLATGRVDLIDCTRDELEALLGAGLRDALASREDGPLEPALLVGTRTAVGPEVWPALRSLPGPAYLLFGSPESAFGATVAKTADAATGRGAGRPMANVETYVLDSRGHPTPVRAVGELYLGGPGLARSCIGDRDAERFVELAPAGESRRLYRTGQLARSLPDGAIELAGSIAEEADLRGFRVRPDTIRAALAVCPGVGEASVALERDARGEPRLVAYVVADGEPPTLSELRAFLWGRLPGYAWPSEAVVVPVGTGSAAGEPTGGTARAAGAKLSSKPSPQESVLRASWGEALGVEGVSSRQNYWQAFSFLEAVALARDAGVSVPGEHVARNRTIEMLAASLAAERHGSEE